MKASFKKRIEKLENIVKTKLNQKRYGIVIYDGDSDFDPATFKSDDVEVGAFLPDKGIDPIDFSTQPYKIIYRAKWDKKDK